MLSSKAATGRLQFVRFVLPEDACMWRPRSVNTELLHIATWGSVYLQFSGVYPLIRGYNLRNRTAMLE